MLNLRKNTMLQMWAIVLVVAFFSILKGDLIPLGDGLGTDGRIYAEMARDYYGQIFERGVWAYSADYYFQRSLPPLLIHSALSMTFAEITNERLIWGFRLFNILSLLAVVSSWLRIARHFRYSLRGQWLGFILLFVNIPNLVVTFYYPTLTDISSLLMAMLILEMFFRRQDGLLLFFTVLSAFVWPIIVILGSLFYLFPSQEGKPNGMQSLPPNTPIRLLIALIAAMAIVAGVILVSLSPYGTKYGLQYAAMHLGEWRVSAGLVVLAAYAGIVSFSFSRWLHWENIGRLIREFNYIRLIPIVLLFVILKFIVWRVTHVSTSSSLIAIVLSTTFSVKIPGAFILKHLLYFGPSFLFLYIFWPRFFTRISDFGYGMLGYCALNMICGFDVESRHLGLLFPVVIIFAVDIWEKTLNRDERTFRLLPLGAAAFAAIWYGLPLFFPQMERYHQYLWGPPDFGSMIVLTTTCLLLGWAVKEASAQAPASTLS